MKFLVVTEIGGLFGHPCDHFSEWAIKDAIYRGHKIIELDKDQSSLKPVVIYPGSIHPCICMQVV